MRVATIISVIFYLLCIMVVTFVGAAMVALHTSVPWWWFVIAGVLVCVYTFTGACATFCLQKGLKAWPWNVMTVALKHKG